MLVKMKNVTIPTSCRIAAAIITLSLLLGSVSHGQNDSGSGEKKKGGFWNSLKQAVIVNGEPIGGSPMGRGTTLRGEWNAYGAGGENCASPRNHTITFDVLRDNSKISIAYESSMNFNATVYTLTGQQLGNLYYQNRSQEFNFIRAGTYKVVICVVDRYAIGNYAMIFGAGIQNIQRKAAVYWHQDQVAFDEEGGGGAGDNYFSPRNHSYTFEPEQGSVYDINVESNGVPIMVAVVDPNGLVNWGASGGGPGVHYVIDQVQRKGTYKIVVATQQPNDRGQYKIEVVGNLIQNPVRLPTQFKHIKGTFSSNKPNQEYIFTAREGVIETIYRSTQAGAEITLSDAYQQEIRSSFYSASTNRFIDESFTLIKKNEYKLNLKSTDGREGNYELLMWGDFENVVSGNTGTVQVSPGSKTKAGQPTGSTVKVSGRIISGQTIDYRSLRVIYENLETGVRIGEVIPAQNGSYSIDLPIGQQYSITALTKDNQIASSQNFDLTTAVQKTELVTLKPITIISNDEVGAKLTLNNIFFETGSPVLLRKSYAELKRIGAFLKANRSVKVEIAGHTDNVGDDNSNFALSQNRAKAVLYYLQDQIDDASRLTARGYGEKEPSATNATDAGRQQNRRVEFRIVSN